MVFSTAASAFAPLVSPSCTPSSRSSLNHKGCATDVDCRAHKGGSMPFSGLQAKAGERANAKASGGRAGLTADATKEAISPTSAPRTFINQLPDWSMLLAAITTIFLAAEKQWTNFDWKPRKSDFLVDPFGIGRIVQDGIVFRQNFTIRSYEIGADRTASIETLMNHLQETSLNHVKNAGLMGGGFGSTPEMSRRNLIWVVTKMQVEVESYPTWGDTVEVDTWVAASGKNCMRRDWLVRDEGTGRILTKATSVWVMMNKVTRKLSKIPDEVKGEITPHFTNRPAVLTDDSRKLSKLDEKTANHIRRGLSPRWYDLDVNQHVNNVKYVGWILESMPQAILESYELAGMTLEYRRECMKDSVLESLTAVSSCENGPAGEVECEHLLRLEDGSEIVRGRTRWRSKVRPIPWDYLSDSSWN